MSQGIELLATVARQKSLPGGESRWRPRNRAKCHIRKAKPVSDLRGKCEIIVRAQAKFQDPRTRSAQDIESQDK